MANPTDRPIVKITLRHAVNADTAIGSRVFWSYTGGTPSIANCVTLATAISGAWGSHLAALMSTAGVLGSVTVQDVTNGPGNEGTFAGTVAGTRSGLNVSNGAASVINLKIASSYRGGKPKIFFPFGVAGDLTDGNTWDSGFQASVNSDYPAWATAVNGQTAGTTVLGVQYNVSYYSGSKANSSSSKWARRNVPAPRATAVSTPITLATLRPELGSQRRRLNQ